jgi:hypothetical protein
MDELTRTLDLEEALLYTAIQISSRTDNNSIDRSSMGMASPFMVDMMLWLNDEYES